MGQKVHPIGIRLGIVREWNARWYADSKNYSRVLHEDIKMREIIKRELSHSAVSRIQIERGAKHVLITIHTAKPGAVIGKKGESIEKIKSLLVGVTKNGEDEKKPVNIVLEEIRKPDLDANLVADNIARQLEKRIQFRRAMKRALSNATRLGALGIKIMVSGRLNGADIARTEWYREGRVPLHTFRADIDYAFAEGLTTYGQIGVKVWVYKGEVLDLNKLYEKPSTKAR